MYKDLKFPVLIVNRDIKADLTFLSSDELEGRLSLQRGSEITILIDDKAFEGSGAFLIGAILDRFLSEYVGLNHFTQTVIRTTERGEIMRWPPRLGLRSDL